MTSNLEKNLSFMLYSIEVAEEKIVEHRLLKKKFESHEEFIIFTIIWLRVIKNIYKKIKATHSINKDGKFELETEIDKFIKQFYINQDDLYLGMTINAVTRESQVPRSTVKRIIEKLIKKELLQKNNNRLIIPTIKVRDLMKDYRQYIFESSKNKFVLFNSLDLKNEYKEIF